MRCVRCEFENIPGETRCIRCGSVLEAGSVAVEVYPPRMPAWQKPFRGAIRWLRGHGVARENLPGRSIRRGLDAVTSDTVGSVLLNVIPGLAHLVQGRFKEVRLLVACWLLALALGLFLYGSTIGLLLIGLAIGLHAWIAVQYGLLRTVTQPVERAGAVLIVTICLMVVYWIVPRVVAPWLTAGHTALTIRAMNIQAGDYFLVRRLPRAAPQLPRGTLVLVRPSAYRNEHRNLMGGSGAVIGQIVGLPGEMVRIQDYAYSVGEQVLDPSRFPVPHWIRGRPRGLDVLVPRDSYFVSTEYELHVHGRGQLMLDEVIRDACVTRASDIDGRAFMLWWPLARRGVIE